MSTMSNLDVLADEHGIDKTAPDAIEQTQRAAAAEAIEYLEEALAAVTTYRKTIESIPGLGSRPAFADLVALDALVGERLDPPADRRSTLGPVETLLALIMARKSASLEHGWESFDEDLNTQLGSLGLLPIDGEEV